jgi:succinyl-CoA synthetase beta subunit
MLQWVETTMKLLEYEAKSLLQKGGIPIPKSFITDKSPAFLPAVLKSQVPTGGRGKAGGIIIVKTQDEYDSAVKKLLQLEIKGFLPKTILAEELLDIKSELYLSLLIDNVSASIVLMAHEHGGVEVEENAAEDFLRLPIDGKNSESVGQQLADYYDLADKTFVLQDMVERLFKLFIDQDMTLLEINPLVVTKSDDVVAGDAKVNLDDAAIFRHPEWSFEQEKTEANFVTLDPNGNVATIANGAGLAMATVDAVADAGLMPANFLDIGGGASEASVLAAFKRIMEYPNIKVIIINIFAGITRCDEVAKAIIAAKSQLTDLPPLAIRLTGTNYDEAAKLLANQNITMQPSLQSAIDTAKGIA